MNLNYLTLLLFCFLCFYCKKENNPTYQQPEQTQPYTALKIIEDRLNGEDIVLIGDPELKFVVAFYNKKNYQFSPKQGELPLLMVDESDSVWDMWGKSVSGPRKGEQLDATKRMYAYWFAWGTFFPGLSVYPFPDNSTAPNPLPGSNNWDIPYESVYLGALPGGIPAIDSPKYSKGKLVETEYLLDSDEIIVINYNEEIKAFPIPILQFHEVVNEENFSILHCPLTGSSSVWKSPIAGQKLSWEVSGYLFNSNLIAKDREIGGFWQQMLQKKVFGPDKGADAATLPMVVTTFDAFRRIFPNEKILNRETGFTRDYGNFPCGDYCTNHEDLRFPIFYDDTRLPRKETVFGLWVNDSVRAYPFSVFH